MPPEKLEKNEEYNKLMSEQENIYDRLSHLYDSLGHLEFDYQNKRNEIIGIISKVERDAKEIDAKVESFIEHNVVYGENNE